MAVSCLAQLSALETSPGHENLLERSVQTQDQRQSNESRGVEIYHFTVM